MTSTHPFAAAVPQPEAEAQKAVAESFYVRFAKEWITADDAARSDIKGWIEGWYEQDAATPSASAPLPEQKAAQVEASQRGNKFSIDNVVGMLADRINQPHYVRWCLERLALATPLASVAAPTTQAVKVPLTEAEILADAKDSLSQRHPDWRHFFISGVRYAERKHGIHSEGERSHD